MTRNNKPCTAQTVFRALVEACKEKPDGVTAVTIAASVGRSYDAVRLRLNELFTVGAVRSRTVSARQRCGASIYWTPAVEELKVKPKRQVYRRRVTDPNTGAPLGTCDECKAEKVAVGEWKGRTLCRGCLCPDTPIEPVGWRTASPTSLF